nr:MAG TPA: Inositol phospholipid synthesis and fat-storage-inducing TM [Caudoviricetes sp.]
MFIITAMYYHSGRPFKRVYMNLVITDNQRKSS